MQLALRLAGAPSSPFMNLRSVSSISPKDRQGSACSQIWWRWRESNPRPKMPQVSVYKLSLVLWFRNEPSHEQDGPSLASEGFSVIGGSDRSHYTR